MSAVNSQNLHQALAQILESWQRAGVTELPTVSAEAVAEMTAALRQFGKSDTGEQLAVNSITPVAKAPAKANIPAPHTATLAARTAVPQITQPAAPAVTPPLPPMPNTPNRPAVKLSKPATKPAELLAPPEDATEMPSLLSAPALPPEQHFAALEIIRAEVAGCTRCTELAATRTQTVFSDGDPNARLCFVGEAPGADEDAQGVPFVGRAGQLLTKIIEACKLARGEVYIANVLKCRPPNNRPPEPLEVHNCRGYLDRQLEIVRPEVIVCLGAVAAKCLLQTEVSIGRLRGKWHDYRGLAVYCTYHPAYLLRNPNAKKDVWEDMKVVMARLGVVL